MLRDSYRFRWQLKSFLLGFSTSSGASGSPLPAANSSRGENHQSAKGAEDGPTLVEFLQTLRHGEKTSIRFSTVSREAIGGRIGRRRSHEAPAPIAPEA